MSSEAIFRAPKRRKVIRRTNDVYDEDALVAEKISSKLKTVNYVEDSEDRSKILDATNTLKLEESVELGKEELRVPDIVRRRDFAKSRRGGIKFTNITQHKTYGSAADEDAPLSVGNHSGAIDIATARFAPQTGVAVENLNKHMMAYVDSKMLKVQKDQYLGYDATRDGLEFHSTGIEEPRLSRTDALQRQPATLGKLHEIDLGPDAMRRNVELTEAATRRFNESQLPDTSAPGQSQRRFKLGRDGRPRPPPRWKKRRTSDDMKRDEMVEKLLKENKLDIYDATEERFLNMEDGEGAADELMAERFRREFLDAIQSRQQAKRSAAGSSHTAGSGAKKPIDPLARGPKLGGSRSARAAMHRAQEEKMGKRL